MAEIAEVYENRPLASMAKLDLRAVVGHVGVGENGRINRHSRNRRTTLDCIGYLTGSEGI